MLTQPSPAASRHNRLRALWHLPVWYLLKNVFMVGSLTGNVETICDSTWWTEKNNFVLRWTCFADPIHFSTYTTERTDRNIRHLYCASLWLLLSTCEWLLDFTMLYLNYYQGCGPLWRSETLLRIIHTVLRIVRQTKSYLRKRLCNRDWLSSY
jgi:hypothetical protein